MSWLGDVGAAIERLDNNPEMRLMVEISARWGTRPSRVIDEWAEDDVTKAMALILWERRNKSKSCFQCGTTPDEWFDDQGRDRDPAPYSVEWETCGGCRALRRARDNVGDEVPEYTRPHLKLNHQDE